MSSKTTILNFPWCHIYEDVEYENNNEIRRLCIDVDYGYTEEDTSGIWVDINSDFAVMFITMIQHCPLSKDDLIEIVRAINKEPK